MIPTEMPRRSALVRFGSLTHCSGANHVRLPRTGVMSSRSPGWLTDPPHVVHEFRKENHDLPGYRIRRSRPGGYEGQDPAVLFGSITRALPAVDYFEEVGARAPQMRHRKGGAVSSG
jgi:hypothetical protein